MSTTIYTRIRHALPIARLMVAEGIDCARTEFTDHIPAEEPTGLTEAQVTQLIKWADAHYVVGIAVGLLLNPTTVLTEKGGRR